MGNFSTLIYLYSNFDGFNNVSENLNEYDLKEFDDILRILDKNVKKVPDKIISNIIEFAKDYS